ncbi:MAG: S-layer protein domain-containing protein, partial [Methanosarcinales archaeon]
RYYNPEDYIFEYYNSTGALIFSANIDGIFRGTEANVVKLVKVNQYSDINGSVLISNASYVYKTGNPTIMSWKLYEGYNITIKDFGINGNKVWLELSKNSSILEDSIISDGNMFTYTQNGIEILKGTIGVFKGTLAYSVKLVNVSQYSEVNGNLLVSGVSKIFATGNPSGEIWKLYEGYSLDPKDSDLDGNKVWLSLSKNGVVVKEDILQGGDTFTYYNSSGVLVFTAKVDAVYRGTEANMVQLRDVMQFSEVDGRILLEFGIKTLTTSSSFTVWAGINLPFNWQTFTQNKITFIGLATGGNPPYNYSWYDNGNNIGNGSSFTSTLGVGTHTITLTVTDSRGATATDQIVIDIKPSKVKGDFNNNGRVDIGDVAKVAYMVVGKVPSDLSADFNNNGRVDLGDAAKIAYYLVGKMDSLD